MDDARGASQAGWMGGTRWRELHVELSRPQAVHPNRMWRWVYDVEDKESHGGGGEKCASRMSARGEGLDLGRVRKNKMIIGNIECRSCQDLFQLERG